MRDFNFVSRGLASAAQRYAPLKGLTAELQDAARVEYTLHRHDESSQIRGGQLKAWGTLCFPCTGKVKLRYVGSDSARLKNSLGVRWQQTSVQEESIHGDPTHTHAASTGIASGTDSQFLSTSPKGTSFELSLYSS